jgi:carbon monoxide dehydrogenase subunit G
MEHEVAVPLPEHTARRALRDPAVLARCLPGLAADEQADQADAVGASVSGRLKLRVGSTSITYRGTLRLNAETGSAVIEAEQAVGVGSVAGTVRVEVLPAEGGAGSAKSCRVLFRASVEAKGRIGEQDGTAVLNAARRLLDRLCAAVAADPGAHSVIGEQSPAPDTESTPAPGPAADAVADADADADADAEPESAPDAGRTDADPPSDPEEDLGALVEQIDATLDAEQWPGADSDARQEAASGDGAEAPPYRRSIVGPSAEEVDHAPPRGRYAPTTPTRSARARAVGRWSGMAGADQRMGEPPVAEAEYNRAPWVVGGVALVGGAVLLVRRLRRR